MKLSDLFAVLSDSVVINVYNLDGELISQQNGRCSIAERLNDCKVDAIYPPAENTVNVFLDTLIDTFQVDEAMALGRYIRRYDL